MREVSIVHRVETICPITFREFPPMYEEDKEIAHLVADMASEACGYITFITEEEV